MLALVLQSALLLLGAYFLGAFVGCLVRRTFFAPAVVQATQRSGTVLDPAPAGIRSARSDASAPSQDATRRFEDALTGTGTGPAAPAPRPQSPAEVVIKPAQPNAPTALADSAEARAPDRGSAAPAPAPAAAPSTPSIAAAAAAAAAAGAGATSVTPAAPAPERSASPAHLEPRPAPDPAPSPTPTPMPVTPAAAPQPPADVKPDDLTRIRAIDEEMARRLNKLGVRSFAGIADWKPDDVSRIARSLGVPGRIEQENWIEQAQILAKGGETYYSRRKARGEQASSRPTPDEGERLTIRVPARTEPVPSSATHPVPAPAPAVPVPAPVPAPMPMPTRAVEAAAEPRVPPAAAAAAAGAVRAAQAAMDAKPKPDEQAHRPAPVIPPQPGAIAAAAAAAAAAAVAGGGTAASTTTPAAVAASAPTPTPAVPAGTTRTVGVSRDNLQRIAGINAEVERLLNVQGVTSYGQIANWSPNDVSRFDRLLGFEGRISRENWIEQARVLAGGGQTAYSRAMDRRMRDAAAPVPHQAPPAEQSHVEPAAPAPTPAPPPASRGDLSRLRSVRSEAYAGDDASARSEATGPGAARAADDLKRIRGVGVLIEKKLNSLGVSRYEQVANWTSADIERFSDKLDFKGRIERENWVEQARILAAGGQTEFSQRVDRGEV